MQRNSFAGWVKIIAVIVWVFAVVAAYFWAHKPFGARIVRGVGQSAAGIVVWLGVSWLGAGLGRRLVGKLVAGDGPAVRLVVSIGLGMGVLALLIVGLGLIGLLRPIVAWGLVGGLGVVLWRDLKASLVDLRLVRLPRPSNGFQRWLLVYAVASLLLTFLVALAPPVGWDTLVYHLTGPRLFAEAGRIVHPFDLPYLGFPQLGEMHFALGLLLGSERSAVLFHLGYGLLAMAITGLLARRAFGSEPAWLAVALLLSVPTLFSLMTRAYVDATLMFYATAAFYAFYRWREAWKEGDAAGGRGWLVVMGAFCGFCGGVKYTAVVIPFALGLSLVWVSRRDGIGKIVGRLALVALVAFVVVVPWLLENWLTTGNPVYPFFLPGGVYWDEWRGRWYDRPGTGLAATDPWRLLIVPLEATIIGAEGTSVYEATIGPLLLASVVPFVVVWRHLGREERAVAGYGLLFFGASYALWLQGLARTALLLRTRFLFLTFGVVAVMGGLALDRLKALRRPQLTVDWLVRAAMSLTLALLLFSALVRFVQINPLPVILGLESRDDYLVRRLGWYYAVIKDVNEKLPSDALVLFLWEPRSYHCEVTCLPDALLDRWPHTTYLYGHDATAITDVWREEGVTHVLFFRRGYEGVVEAGFDPVTPADQETLTKLLAEEMVAVMAFGDVYELYAFPEAGQP